MISDENLSVDFTFNLPFCLHLPDGEYNIKLSEGGSVILGLEKKVPESYDERTGYRGLIEQDLKNVAVMDVSKDDAEKALSVVQQLITILSPLI